METTLEEKPMDEMEKVEATKIIANTAIKHQWSNVTLNNRRKDSAKDNKREDAKNKKDSNVVDEEMKWQTTKNVVTPAKWCQRSVASSIN